MLYKEAATIPAQAKLTGKKVASALNKKRPAEPGETIIYKCTRCGKTRTDPKGYFFMSKTSPLFVSNELYACICSDCANELMEDARTKYKDTKLALIIICHYLDIFFSEELYESVKDNANFSLGNYLKNLNGIQYKAKNFTSFLVGLLKDGATLRGSTEIQREKEVKWCAADTKNKNYVLQSIGYDCFDDENYTDANRKFLFNTLADYLTDDVLEDPHKIQAVITIVKTLLQIENLDKIVNSEMRQSGPDHSLIKTVADTKDKLLRSVNQTAGDNAISAKGGQRGSRNAGSLTAIMKEMAENGFEEIKVNVVDAHLSESFKEVAQENAKALINELNFTSDEYARMLADQSVLLTDSQEKILMLEEEIRKLKIEAKKNDGGE